MPPTNFLGTNEKVERSSALIDAFPLHPLPPPASPPLPLSRDRKPKTQGFPFNPAVLTPLFSFREDWQLRGGDIFRSPFWCYAVEVQAITGLCFTHSEKTVWGLLIPLTAEQREGKELQHLRRKNLS